MRRIFLVILFFILCLTDSATAIYQASGLYGGAAMRGADTNAPTIMSASINADALTINFSESVSQGTGYNDTDFDVDMSTTGNNIAVTYVSGNGTSTWAYTTASPAVYGETVDLDFNGDADSVEDGAGNDLAAVVSQSVTNNTPSGATYLVNQNFEGTGYDNSESWTEAASPDPDYTTTVLRGSQSLACVNDYASSYTSFTAISGQADIFFRFRVTGLPASNASFVYIRDSSGSVIGSARLYSNGDVRVYHGTDYGTAGASTISVDTTYYIWIDYTAGTGSNGTLNFYIATSTTKPGSASIALTAGTSTADMGRIMLSKDSADAITFIFDQVLVDDATIGNVDA